MASIGSLNMAALFNISKEDTKDFKFFKLKELYVDGQNNTYPVKGVFFSNKSKYGKSAYIATDGFFINLPAHKIKDCETIVGDMQMVEEINNGKAGIKIREYTDSKNEKQYTVDFCLL